MASLALWEAILAVAASTVTPSPRVQQPSQLHQRFDANPGIFDDVHAPACPCVKHPRWYLSTITLIAIADLALEEAPSTSLDRTSDDYVATVPRVPPVTDSSNLVFRGSVTAPCITKNARIKVSGTG